MSATERWSGWAPPWEIKSSMLALTYALFTNLNMWRSTGLSFGPLLSLFAPTWLHPLKASNFISLLCRGQPNLCNWACLNSHPKGPFTFVKTHLFCFHAFVLYDFFYTFYNFLWMYLTYFYFILIFTFHATVTVLKIKFESSCFSLPFFFSKTSVFHSVFCLLCFLRPVPQNRIRDLVRFNSRFEALF